MKQYIKHQTAFFFLLCLLPLLGGCAATSLDVSLENGAGVDIAIPAHATIGVDEFVDRRPQAMGNDGKTRLGLIPGILWLQIDSDLPEIYTAFSSFKSKPLNENTARAVVRGLQDAGITENVIYLPDSPRAAMDYRLEGSLQQSLIKETGYYYGSAMYVWLPRILGAPYVSYDMAMEVDLLLREVKTEKILWQGVIRGERADKYLNIYQIANGREGKHLIAYHFADILTKGLDALIPELHATLLREAPEQ